MVQSAILYVTSFPSVLIFAVKTVKIFRVDLFLQALQNIMFCVY